MVESCDGYTKQKANVKANHPADNLLAVISCWASRELSTSDVERGFSVTSSLRGGRSEDLHFQREEDILTVKTANLPPPDVKKLMAEPMQLWAVSYGRPRKVKPEQTKLNQGI